jgi:hypothetical protein
MPKIVFYVTNSSCKKYTNHSSLQHIVLQKVEIFLHLYGILSPFTLSPSLFRTHSGPIDHLIRCSSEISHVISTSAKTYMLAIDGDITKLSNKS